MIQTTGERSKYMMGSRLERATWSAIALVASALIALSLCLAPNTAYADVRKADIIAGVTVEDRDFSVAECPSVSAAHAILMSADGTVYFNRDAYSSTQIASITKVMTAMVALDYADDSLKVTVTPEAAEIGESSAGLQEGDVLTFDAALKALLVPSGNDAAIAIADAVGERLIEEDPSLGDDPQAAFVEAMNRKASEIGLSDTVYENPHGLDDGEYEGDLHSTAADQAIVARCAMEYPEIREIVGGGTTTIEVKRDGGTEKIELETTDVLLESYAYAIGIKTGMTDSAGPSFMGAANKDGRELYAIVLGADDDYSRFQDAKVLFEWGYDHIVDLPLANSAMFATMTLNGESRQVPVIGEAPHYEWLDKTVKVTLEDPDAVVNVFDLEGNVTQDVSYDEINGPVRAGDKVGTVTFLQHNEVIAQQNLIACEDVEAPNPLETVSIWWERTTRGLSAEEGRATQKVYNVMPIINDNTTNAA